MKIVEDNNLSQKIENTPEDNDNTNKPLEETVAKTKKKTRKIPKCVRPEEFKSLIEVVPKKDYKARIGFLLAYGSGMRVSEVLRCSPAHLRPNSIFIPESKYGVEGVVPKPKGWKSDFEKFMPLKTTARSLQRKFKKYASKSNLPLHYTFHSLRHGFATRCLESGMPLNQVQLLMRHSNISTTSVYTRASPTDAIKNYEDLF